MGFQNETQVSHTYYLFSHSFDSGTTGSPRSDPQGLLGMRAHKKAMTGAREMFHRAKVRVLHAQNPKKDLSYFILFPKNHCMVLVSTSTTWTQHQTLAIKHGTNLLVV